MDINKIHFNVVAYLLRGKFWKFTTHWFKQWFFTFSILFTFFGNVFSFYNFVLLPVLYTTYLMLSYWEQFYFAFTLQFACSKTFNDKTIELYDICITCILYWHLTRACCIGCSRMRGCAKESCIVSACCKDSVVIKWLHTATLS